MLKLCAYLFFILNTLSFSQSQVIIKKLDWKIYSTEHFDIYYYDDSKLWLNFLAKTLENAYREESRYLNPKINKKIPFFIFASINDMEQNSISEVGDGVGGLTEPFKDRFMVWSDGSMSWLEDVIYHELTHEMQFSVLLDGFWKSARILKTYVYPLWMMEGMAEYSTKDGDLAIEDMYIRDSVVDNKLISLKKLHGFSHLKPHQTTLAYKTGSAAMKFLSSEYGAEKQALMLQLYKNRYDINSVLYSLIGTDIDAFDRKFKEYEQLKYKKQIEDKELIEIPDTFKKITEQKDIIPDFNLTPVYKNGVLAYISTYKGHPPIVVVEKNGKKKTLNFKYMDIENIPYSRFTKPIRSLDISNDGRFLIFNAQKNHIEYLCVYDIENEKFKKYQMKDFIEARQFVFSPDNRKISFIAMKEGVNDIYTMDFYDGFVNLESIDKITDDLSLLKKNALTNIQADISISSVSLSSSSLSNNLDGFKDKSSPYYLSANSLIYSCENEYKGKYIRDICQINTESKKKEVFFRFYANIYDFAYDKNSNELYFTSDKDDVFALYSLSLNDGKLRKLLNLIGGVFTPYYDEKEDKFYFSYFRHGSINIYLGNKSNFNNEKQINSGYEFKNIVSKDDFNYENKIESSPVSGVYKDYKFKASTDLFFPALMFSSPGGLFLMTYWQFSDFLGYHNISSFINYNSAYPYFNGSIQYLYNRYRTKMLFSKDIYLVNDLEDDYKDKYDRRYDRNMLGFIYPLDRYDSLGLYLISKDDIKKYYYPYKLNQDYLTRAFQLSFMNNTLNGLYLSAIEGSSYQLIWQKGLERFDGNQKYDVYSLELLKYLPIDRRSTVANRFFFGFSTGRDKKNFSFGGINGLRGYPRYNDMNENSRVLNYNLEGRILLKDMDYHMWYMFPDFYFKAMYLKIFSDNAYGWENNEISNFKMKDIKNSIGLGVNFNTFILQSFQMILSFDYAMRTDDGSKIFYFYLGPLF
jgi:hypothetical protein